MQEANAPYLNVAISGLSYVDAPNRITSQEICERLAPTMERLGVRTDLLEDVSGITARRVFDEGVQPSDAATQAGEKAIDDAGVDRANIGICINTSVCRDFLEPSTACIVHGNLGLSDRCKNFDVGNACLAFLNGMELAANMIERGDVEHALIVDGETSGTITENTIKRLLDPNITEEAFRAEFASLTLGSGAAAMVMSRADLVDAPHRFRGVVTRAATEFNRLCIGNIDRMITDTKSLLIEGLKLAHKTYNSAVNAFGWAVDELDEFVIHQVSRAHTEQLMQMLGIDSEKVHRVYPEYGNIGPAGIAIVLAKLKEMGRLQPGKRVALMGIGSGLNCSMADIVW